MKILLIIFLILFGAVIISSKATKETPQPTALLQPTLKPTPTYLHTPAPTLIQTPIPTPAVNTNPSSIKLESVSPNIASINSQLIIKGQKFGQNQGKVLIYTRGSTLYSSLYEIEKWSDAEIVIKFKFVGGGQFYTRIETADGQKSNELALTVIGGQPYIASVSPTNFKKGQTITIAGYDFGSSAGRVNFNSNSGYGNLLGYGIIGSWTDTQIVFTVPPNLESKEYALEVITSDNRKSSYKYFNVND